MKTVIHLSLLQLGGWTQLEVCFSKPELCRSPDHPSLSVFIQIFISFRPLTFGLSRFFSLRAQPEGEGGRSRETGVLCNNVLTGESNRRQNSD